MSIIKLEAVTPKKTVISNLIKAVISEPETPQQAKAAAIGALLANIQCTNLIKVCESLGGCPIIQPIMIE